MYQKIMCNPKRDTGLGEPMVHVSHKDHLFVVFYLIKKKIIYVFKRDFSRFHIVIQHPHCENNLYVGK